MRDKPEEDYFHRQIIERATEAEDQEEFEPFGAFQGGNIACSGGMCSDSEISYEWSQFLQDNKGFVPFFKDHQDNI